MLDYILKSRWTLHRITNYLKSRNLNMQISDSSVKFLHFSFLFFKWLPGKQSNCGMCG